MQSRIACIVANANDEEMEAWVKKCAGPEDMLEMMTEIAEHANFWIGTYKAGIETFTMMSILTSTSAIWPGSGWKASDRHDLRPPP